MKFMAVCGKEYRHKVAYFKNAVNFLFDQIYKINLYGCVPTYVHVRECRSLKG
jgi:hypothetical protein